MTISMSAGMPIPTSPSALGPYLSAAKDKETCEQILRKAAKFLLKGSLIFNDDARNRLVSFKRTPICIEDCEWGLREIINNCALIRIVQEDINIDPTDGSIPLTRKIKYRPLISQAGNTHLQERPANKRPALKILEISQRAIDAMNRHIYGTDV